MKNLKAVAEFLCECANVGVEYSESKSFKVLGQLMDEVIDLAKVDWKELPNELKEMKPEDLDLIVRAKLDFEDDVLEEKVENIVLAVLKIGEIGKELYEIFKKPSE